MVTSTRKIFSYVKMFNRIKKAVAPREPLFFYIARCMWFQKRISRNKYRTVLERSFRVFGRDNIAKAKNLKKPILGVLCNHGSFQEDHLMLDAFPEVVALSSYDFQRDNIVLTDQDISGGTLLKLYALLKQGQVVVMSFDGGFGKREMMCDMLGHSIYFSRGYSALVKSLQPVVLPFTRHYGKKTIDYFVAEPLFTNDEIIKLSEEEILKKTVDYFTRDIKIYRPHQINYKWFYNRLRLTSGTSDPNEIF